MLIQTNSEVVSCLVSNAPKLKQTQNMKESFWVVFLNVSFGAKMLRRTLMTEAPPELY